MNTEYCQEIDFLKTIFNNVKLCCFISKIPLNKRATNSNNVLKIKNTSQIHSSSMGNLRYNYMSDN